MHTVKITKEELLSTIIKNRESHRKIFDEAIVGYREQAIKELDAMLAEAKEGKRIRRAVSLIEPIDQTREYDKAIKMLQMSVDDVIELDEHQFSQYVLDDWGWKKSFLHSNRGYSATAALLATED